MKYRQLTPGGPDLSVIGLGNWLTMGQRLNERASERLTHHAVSLGINFFDTADIYGEGDAERSLGKALRGIPRDAYFIATKCFFATQATGGSGGLSRTHVMESVDKSLANLGIAHIDLMQCHRFDHDTPLEETILAMGSLEQSGKIRYWGVSRWTADQMRETIIISQSLGVSPPVTNQYFYNLFSRDIELDLIPEADLAGWGVLVYSPLAQGVLSGKYSSNKVPARSRASDPQLRRSMWDFDASKLLQAKAFGKLAAQHGATPAQLALAWCLKKPAIRSVITGATSTEQISENVAAAALEVPDDLSARIEDIFGRRYDACMGAHLLKTGPGQRDSRG